MARGRSCFRRIDAVCANAPATRAETSGGERQRSRSLIGTAPPRPRGPVRSRFKGLRLSVIRAPLLTDTILLANYRGDSLELISETPVQVRRERRSALHDTRSGARSCRARSDYVVRRKHVHDQGIRGCDQWLAWAGRGDCASGRRAGRPRSPEERRGVLRPLWRARDPRRFMHLRSLRGRLRVRPARHSAPLQEHGRPRREDAVHVHARRRGRRVQIRRRAPARPSGARLEP